MKQLTPLQLNLSVGAMTPDASLLFGTGEPRTGTAAESASTHSPRLGLVAAEDLIGSKQIQLAMALLKHVDTRKPPGGCYQSLLHTGRIHQLPLLYCAGGEEAGFAHVSQYRVKTKQPPTGKRVRIWPAVCVISSRTSWCSAAMG